MFDALKEKLSSLFSKLGSKGRLSPEDIDAAMRELRRSLLEADVDFRVAKDLIAKIRERSTSAEVLQSITPNERISAIVYEELVSLMGKPAPLIISPKPPTVILMAGLQGSGKTTTTVKLARHLKGSHNPLVVACDLRRPAAVEQLKVLADGAKVAFFGPNMLTEELPLSASRVPPKLGGMLSAARQGGNASSTDVLAVVRGAVKYAEGHLNDVIILDTAGRLHIDDELMGELKAIADVLPPHEKILVVDAMTGQEAVNSAKAFHDLLNLTGLILTKLDGDARGGSALSIRAVTGVPVKFAGIGENTDALEVFSPERMSGRIMGMGDIQGLVEKVKAAGITDTEIKSPGKIAKSFDLDMLLKQFEALEKMGPLDKVMGMIPGVDKIKGFRAEDADASALKRSKAIIQSMTREERRNPRIIKGSRRRRIAEGSGTSVQSVNQLLAQYEQMKKMFKSFSGSGGSRRLKSLFGFGK
ncbi:MAG: signal recognition particle protein [Synergistaceae bacterium]|nr:signal recognition particle protein [Synergistaceae bacterium]MBQ3397934.1 signal recognition particle protein [Synergistaceae bacterium]MBQ6114769.1 signal recognition particle protein [Synergistaceae bacterium]MBQ6418328.1 signal recognition particle protein [Synergistaceae bacterium]MBQ6666447.1 signal recognition particle protein [Synergistaceae bacterium]